MDRIWEKLGEPEACLVIGHFAANREVVAMALAEPGRAEHGSGAVIPGYGHLSMVFVHPDLWDKVSAACCCKDFTSVHRKEAGRTTPWTRASNVRARRLYEGRGYRRSSRETTLGSGDPILQFERQAF